MTYKLFLLGGAAAAAVAGYSLWPVKAPRPKRAAETTIAPVRGERSDADGVRLQNDLSRLRGEVGDVRSQLSTVQADLNRRAAASAEPDQAASREEAQAQEEEQRHAHMSAVAAAFEREQRSATWAPSTTTFVQEKLKATPALAGAGPIDCRSSTCRFEVDREGDLDKQLPLFLNSLGQTLPFAEADYQVVNGKGRYTFFLKDRVPGADTK